jgi:hypothetical protein
MAPLLKRRRTMAPLLIELRLPINLTFKLKFTLSEEWLYFENKNFERGYGCADRNKYFLAPIVFQFMGLFLLGNLVLLGLFFKLI